MNINCWQSDEEGSNPGNLPKWSDIPETPLDIDPPVDPNDLRIKQLENVPPVIIEEQKRRVKKFWN